MNKRFLLLNLLLLLRADISASASTPCAILSATPSSLTFPITPVNGTIDTMSFVIKNTGDISWSPNVSLITPNDGSFTILSFDTTSIPPGGSKKIMVEFSPITVSKDSAAITFPNAGPCGNDLMIKLNGEGGCAVLKYYPTTPLVTGQNETIQFTSTITNSGNISWSPSPVIISGNGSSCFKIVAITPVPVLPNGSATLTMIFHLPLGADSCCANISFPNATPCGNPLSIYICGYSKDLNIEKTPNPIDFTLDQNFPNPFTNKTSFNYSIPKETEINITLNDLNGKLIRTITNGIVTEGKHLVSFDASNLPSGTYICVLESGTMRLTRELILAK